MTGSVALLTGASRGIGEATARALGRQGVQLALAASDAERLAAAARGLRAGTAVEPLLLSGDLSSPRVAARWVDQTLEHFGRLDVLVNNAAIIDPIGAFENLDLAACERSFAVNLLAPMHACQAALPALRRARGRIVNVSSGAGVRAVAGWSAYCISKAGLNSLTQMLAAEIPEVVTVAFSPGMTDTDMQAQVRAKGAQNMPAATLERFVQAHESGALHSVDHVAAALTALALHADKTLTGQFVPIGDERLQSLLARLQV